MCSQNKYTKTIYWSEEDNCFIGQCPELIIGGIHGRSEKEVFSELTQAIHEAEALLIDRLPKPTLKEHYSGKFVLRTSEAMHRQLALRAMQAGVSLNEYCLEKLHR